MLHNEARELLVEAYEKTGKAKEVAERRNFMDMELCQLDKIYVSLLANTVTGVAAELDEPLQEATQIVQ